MSCEVKTNMAGEAKYGLWESSVRIEKYLPGPAGSHLILDGFFLFLTEDSLGYLIKNSQNVLKYIFKEYR